jgi:hypothetical protein
MSKVVRTSALVLLALVLFPATPASAVLDGTVDTIGRYPNVGLVMEDGEPLCTGTLFRTEPSQQTSNLVLTAGHCSSLGSGDFSFTLDPNAGTGAPISGPVYDGVAYTHPDFVEPEKINNSLPQAATSDVGVIVLDRPVPGVVPADLPALGLVDTLNLKTQVLTMVGYGINQFENANNFTYGPRTYKDLHITQGQRTSIADAFLKETTGQCSGDSGGPHFVKDTSTIVSVSSWVQSYVCASSSYSYRIDSASALNFLHHPTTIGVPNLP